METFARASTDPRDWQSFTSSWENLGLDLYMADGGRYRRRRFAAFHLTSDLIERKPHQRIKELERQLDDTRAFHTKKLREPNGKLQASARQQETRPTDVLIVAGSEDATYSGGDAAASKRMLLM